MQNQLHQAFGNIDIYLFDQLLKGTYSHCHKVLDAGCGGGRNLVYFLQNGFDVHGIDPNPKAITAVRELAAILGKDSTANNFQVAPAEDMPFEDDSFDLVISSAVLHFAHNEQHFEAMLDEMWRVLKPGGYFFARLASDIGIESLVKPLGNNRFLLPDGSERYLVNEQALFHHTQKRNAYLHEPIKTTNVQNLRCMTTWCLQKQ
ncbi:class I SAM-dependent methyltransferase [Mucilaginibacter sp. Bleaf8]|uniref:class I SAM-dependent methyltransferase n=1 Tax=Mucilaginibacter sp. Bleaf8 TaxID=2834430 RepID=UPI001BCB975A|nr:class I SAM-dependent methyltransferase [Mucilaginibacter sp. Bleaf8]MBS7564645.1 class I SAM-dependent methyltransferase [Mucilaginibacter sp. Bleaf8]